MTHVPCRAVYHVCLALALAGCTDEAFVVRPIYEQPVDDPDATAAGLDSLTLSVARAGSPADLASISFAPGDRVALPGVPFDDDLVIHLAGRVGGSDVAYGRSCSFALAPDAPPPEPRVFFARNVKFASLAHTPIARSGGHAITDAEGGAIVLGGNDGGAPVTAVERFDPRTGTLAPLATLEPRTGAIATTLGIGATARAVVLGGAGARLVELIDAEGRREVVDDSQLAMARTEQTATTLTDGRVVAIGGRAAGAVSPAIAEIRSEGGATEIRQLRATLAVPRAGHTATRLGDDVGAPVLITGGLDGDGAPVAVAELFKPLSGELASPTTFAPVMVVPRTRHAARLMPDGSVLILGGLDAAGAPVRTLERFTIDAGFVAVGELPAGAGVIDLTTTTLPDGRVLIAGGRLAPEAAAIRESFIARLDVTDGSVDVVATDRLAEPRAGHQAALLCDGTVLVTGGTPGPAIAERYNPPPAGRR
jgi:hypothetical protein